MSRHAIARTALLVMGVWLSCVSLWAGGAQETETEVQLVQPPAYIAPGKPETGHDKLVIENIRLKIDRNGSIKSYTLNIYNKRGEVVYSVSDSKLEGRGFFGDLLNLGDVPQVKIPSTMNWPGTGKDSKVQPDGEYSYQLTVLDSFGKKTTSPPLAVIIDTVAPDISRLQASLRVVSPNGDGIRDVITFSQNTAPAYKWIREIRAEDGTVVWKSESTAGGDTAASDTVLADDLVWDCKANQASPLAASGAVVPEGNYKMVLAGIDRAGNRAEKTAAFIVSMSQGDISLGIKDNKDALGSGQTLEFLPFVKDAKGLVSWKVDVLQDNGIVWRRFTGKGVPPASLAFDGKGQPGRPETGTQLPANGNYSAVLSATYDSGATSLSEEVPFQVDTLPPQAWVILETAPEGTPMDQTLVFGGAAKTGLNVKIRHEDGLSWKVRLQKLQDLGSGLASLGNPVETLLFSLDEFMAGGATLGTPEAVSGQAWSACAWQGSLPGGKVLSDGLWEISAVATDKAGNVGVSNVARFIRDTRPRGTLTVDMDSPLLLPGLKQDRDVLKATLKAPVTDGIASMEVRFVAKGASSYHTRSGREWIGALEWDGKRNNGQDAPDGQYALKATVKYLNGDTLEGEGASWIFLSRSRPDAKVSADRFVFSPNGDGKADSITISQSAGIPGSWTGTILDPRGEAVKTLTWEGMPEGFTWDGLGPDGAALPDGIYRYQLSGVDPNGIAGVVFLDGLRIDNLSETIAISADVPVISPNGDGYLDGVTITPFLSLPGDLSGWEVRLESGDSEKTFTGGSKLPATLYWDGTNDKGALVDGAYQLYFSVEYKGGSTVSRQADRPVVLVRNPPKGNITAEPSLFSPDGDGDRDTVTFLLDARAADRPVAEWKVEVLDPTGQVFRTFGGKGMPPAELVWDGKSESGELVQSAMDYSAVFTLTDEVHNTHRSLAEVDVDILVMHEGNRLRINIPSIEFSGNSSDLFRSGKTVLANNLDTLRRLARILRRYDTYKIRIEGHATYVWAKTAAERKKEESKELQPLSLARAREVREALAILGIDWDRMSEAGLGGSRPVVSHDDVKNRWKNRRVEFILERPEAGK